MTTFIIKETSDIASDREGVKVNCDSLVEAMKFARAEQCFYKTVMKVESEDGEVLAYRKGEAKWVISK